LYITEKNLILDEIHCFNSNLYKLRNITPHPYFDSIKDNVPKISKSWVDFIEKLLTIFELNETLISMKQNKAPGIDGFF
jgi:hypothetical protein